LNTGFRIVGTRIRGQGLVRLWRIPGAKGLSDEPKKEVKKYADLMAMEVAMEGSIKR
jgi:hypothetical protein